jgi:hypothetical protein
MDAEWKLFLEDIRKAQAGDLTAMERSFRCSPMRFAVLVYIRESWKEILKRNPTWEETLAGVAIFCENTKLSARKIVQAVNESLHAMRAGDG